MTTTPRPLPDADVRQAILNDIDTNMVVEAAAGTGKTTRLVGRLMTLFRRGALSGQSRLAAVTFTHKAAAELRERLDHEVEAALANPNGLSPDERRNLAAAADVLPECHIGTIHSFCARLLRERPVEAGIGPDFEEIDDEDDALLRRQAWDALAAAMGRGEHRDLVRVFTTFGLDQAQLAEGFVTFAEYPDVGRWLGLDDSADPKINDFIAGLEKFLAILPEFGPQLNAADPGRDHLMPALQIIRRRLPRLRRPVSLAQAYRLCGLFRENITIVEKQWLPLGLDKKGVAGLKDAYPSFYCGVVQPFRDACLSAVYRATMQAFAAAQSIYDRMRRERGVLNFQDLLLATAAMLRNYPRVRADLAERYARLLVDEVQDTDPVQATIMFLLADARDDASDWRTAQPRPGSLFIVGDPKQSIYRFRRADIVVYQEMKEVIRRAGGRVVGLSSNFRSHPAIVHWVNQTYGPDDSLGDVPPTWTAASGRFGMVESPYGPAYIPLQPALGDVDGCFAGVYSLATLKEDRKAGIKGVHILRDEAARIASFIRHAVDTGLPLPERNGTTRPARAGDFLIVTYRKASSAVYAAALRRLGLACVVSSGGTLKDSPTLAALLEHTAAMAEPDNPILTTAVLRNGLFGISDRDLYRWRQEGGSFLYTASIPDVPSPVGDALRMLSKHHRWFTRHAPARALGMVVDDLGLWAHSCLGDDPDSAVGAVATALDLLDGEAIPTVGALAERLAWHIDSHEADILPARKPQTDAVRIMNLHKTKGLEAPVVFLTSTRTVRKHPPTSAIRRDGDTVAGALVIRTGEHKERLLAQPAGWREVEEDEACFLAAEKTRLNYVAATRARAALIVSINRTKDGWQSAFLPAYRPGETITNALPEPPAAQPPLPSEEPSPEAIDGDALERAAEERRARLDALLQPTYRTVRAKPDGDWRSGWSGAGDPDIAPEQAALLGEVVHRLLEDPACTRADATALLAEYELPGQWAGKALGMAQAVWNSSLWQRAKQSERLFQEAPFTRHRVDDGLDTLERGIIDLVFWEKDGWVIVDYKTDNVPDGEAPTAAQRHRDQLAAYAAAWHALTGQPVVETGIFFVRTGDYVPLPS